MQKTAKIKKSNLQQKNNEKQIINNLDIRSFYEDALNIELGKPNDKGFVQIHCPFHDDTSPSFSVNLKYGGWK